ncbi:Putative monopolin complex subunit Csm1/Pcs1, csm1/Pcs1 domain superfamily [Septoria linicola]|uniref:Monopolin complex subunit Csm1/Pcs1, csm1/Pcs1 domain superfamily n=1 Tax=Septoria linicola TaxID=215465 RepID=A0A9Q9ASV4_9PEZI|nr:putative monopolin complex subunit Csm1/Pcs1, csm1/Pcs1 domain superfamily [Septoria linicola]USW54500.1 Putative monopolin complex subunit Csm1/Pcs1, csm1/Pcs1 domain superfamily [Septoria linicola]
MPPRVKAQIAAGADESEDDLLATTATKRSTTTKMPKAKAAVARRVSGSKATATKRKAAPRQPRQALKDRTNLQDGNETEEVDEFDNEEAVAKPMAKRAKTTATRKNTKAAAQDDAPKETKTAGAKRGRGAKRAPSPEPMVTIPETQPDPEYMEDIEQSIEIDADNMDIEKERTPPPTRIYAQRAPSVPTQPLLPRPSARAEPLQPRLSGRAASAQPSYQPVRSRDGSVSAPERRGGDPELRRQLNDITKKYESLHLKYENLEEIGKTSAESNFEKLKRASDQKAKDAQELIASLKRELAEVKKSSSSVSSETTGLQKQVTALEASSQRIEAERNELKEKLKLSENEVKSLEAKLNAARQQISNTAQETKMLEAAAKKNSNISVNQSETQKEAKMKENLYADLTGLIISGVKRHECEDIYNCIQTGRNGTLQFHLSVGNDATTPNPKTPSGLSHEEAEFAYEPVLDESRDRELLELLPDYLTEEICFPRNHAQRFYGKVVESMTKKIVVEDD